MPDSSLPRTQEQRRIEAERRLVQGPQNSWWRVGSVLHLQDRQITVLGYDDRAHG